MAHDQVNKDTHTKKKTGQRFLTRYVTNWSVLTQRNARSLKFWIYKEEEFYYQWSENKGAHQLCSYYTACLRLCFCIG